MYIDAIILRYSNEVVVLKIALWTPWSGRSLQIFGGTYYIRLQGGRVSRAVEKTAELEIDDRNLCCKRASGR
jgi:hypothetical protein